STTAARLLWSYVVSLSVQPSEDGPVRVCPTLRIWRVRLATVPTAGMVGPLGSRKAIVPCSFLVLRREGLAPGNRQPRVSEERSPKGLFKHMVLRSTSQRRVAFHPQGG